MSERLAPDDFWARPAAVQSLRPATSILDYETWLLVQSVEQLGSFPRLKHVEVLGVGLGRELPEIRRVAPDATIRATDISEPMVEACRAEVIRMGLERVSVEVGGAHELRRPSTPADLVVGLSAVLCYPTPASSRRAAFANVAQLLRPDGVLAIVVHQRNGRPDWSAWFGLRALAAAIHLVDGEPGDRISRDGEVGVLFHHFRPNELRRLLDDVGFSDARVTSLRSWARDHDHRLRWGSPNPLLVTARRR